MRSRSVVGIVLAATLLLAGCQSSEPAEKAPTGADYPSGPVTMTAGSGPGSGFDLTIRSVVEALEKERIVDVPLPVQNRPGGVGSVFLATMVEQYKGDDHQLAVTSLAMMTNELRGLSKYGYEDVTMIARVMIENFVVVTGPGSRFTDLGSLMAAIKADPAKVRVGAATDDEIPFDLLVSKAGIKPATVNFVPFEGGGAQSAALAKGDIDVAIAGVSEVIGSVKAGELKALGVLAENRLPGLDAPTAREQGLDVTLANWRGIYGPRGMPDFAVAYWKKALGEMVESATWKQIAERNQFTTAFLTGDQFQSYLKKTQADVKTALEQTGN
jgi:putative tricarboxylic transport membrane protein